MVGAVNVCVPDEAKLGGSARMHRVLPGEPLLSSFSVAVSSLPAVTVSAMVWKLKPIESSS